MNLGKLFDMQRVLDERIIKDKGLEGKELLPGKILALQVELGELANEWRGFKFWSHDMSPRTKEAKGCFLCSGTGDQEYDNNYEYIYSEAKGDYVECEDCGGTGIDGYRNPMLEEYVDCLHFILSLGLQLGHTTAEIYPYYVGRKLDNVIEQFIGLFMRVCELKDSYERECNIRDRYIKMLYDFIILGEMLGFTWEQIEKAYFEKNKVNHQRQREGY